MSNDLSSRRRAFLTGAAGGVFGFAAGTQVPGEAAGRVTPAPAEASGAVRGFASVRSFGAIGDGRADDTRAIQAAIDTVAAVGGEVYFEPGRYRLTKALHVRSAFPVSLVGEMAGQMHDPGSGGPALVVGAAMEAMVEYSSPERDQRNAHGSGVVRGLAFIDASTDHVGRPGRFPVVAALHLRDFSLGLVEGCSFHWIRGSAIRTDYAVMTTLKGCRIRYCGDIDRPERSAIYIGGSNSSLTSQSLLIEDFRIEVCYARYYVAVLAPAFDVSLRSCFFEAATTELPESSTTFLTVASDRFLIDGCTFNRTDAVAVKLRGRGKLLGCTFTNGIGAATSLELSGDRCIVAQCTFEDNREALSIDCSGPQNQIAGNTFYYSGGVRLTGRGNIFSNNVIVNPRMKGPGWWLELKDRSVAEGNRFDGNGARPAVGGISSEAGNRVANNSFDRWAPHPCIHAPLDPLAASNTFTDVARPFRRD